MNNIPWSPVFPNEQDPHFDRSAPTQVRFIRFVVRQTPTDEQDPISNVAVGTQGCFLRSAVSQPRFHRLFRPSPPDEHNHAFRSDLAGWLPRVPLPPDEHDAFRCLPMNTTHSVASP